jgi:predicted transglutaminase-like cysteine proteinase
VLNKTIVLGLALLALLGATTPGHASLDNAVSGLRPAFSTNGNWLTNVVVARGAAFGAVPAVLEASVELAPMPRTLAPAPVSGGEYGLFGSVALPMSALPATRQWQRVSSIDFTRQYGAHCAVAACQSGVSHMLMQAALIAHREPALDAITTINNSDNHLIRYRADGADIWATPTETAARGAGDCEDFAIAKLWLLRSIGYTADQLQLVVLKDTRHNAYHAVLAVHLNGQSYILDNLSSRVLPDGALKNYVPIESFSGSKSFIHGFAKKPVIETAALTTVQPAAD